MGLKIPLLLRVYMWCGTDNGWVTMGTLETMVGFVLVVWSNCEEATKFDVVWTLGNMVLWWFEPLVNSEGSKVGIYACVWSESKGDGLDVGIVCGWGNVAETEVTSWSQVLDCPLGKVLDSCVRKSLSKELWLQERSIRSVFNQLSTVWCVDLGKDVMSTRCFKPGNVFSLKWRCLEI